MFYCFEKILFLKFDSLIDDRFQYFKNGKIYCFSRWFSSVGSDVISGDQSIICSIFGLNIPKNFNILDFFWAMHYSSVHRSWSMTLVWLCRRQRTLVGKALWKIFWFSKSYYNVRYVDFFLIDKLVKRSEIMKQTYAAVHFKNVWLKYF